MRTAFLYAGQGSQYAGMGKDLYEAFPEFRRIYEEVQLPFDIKRLSFEDSDGKINETRYTQPLMLAFACGVTEILKGLGVKPEYAAGLSLGEYSALVAAEVLEPQTAIRLAAFRGEQMELASRGIESGMAAILGLPEEELLRCCRDASSQGIVSICNYNCPGQLVIGGEKRAVEEAGRLAVLAGARRAVPLKVSGPFHTSFMRPAGEALAGYFQGIRFREPKAVMLYNATGREDTEGLSVQELLVRQVQSPVRMESILRRLLTIGVERFIEIGPGKTLSGFLKKTAKEIGREAPEILPAENAEELRAIAERVK